MLSRRFLVLPALALVVAGCAARPRAGLSPSPPRVAPAAAVVDAVPAAATDEAAAALGALVLDVARALVAAARGDEHDPRFDCAGLPDLGDTSEAVVERFAALASPHAPTAPAGSDGAAELVVAGLDGIRLDTRASGAWPNEAPREEGDYAPPEEQSAERWLELRADAAVFPDGRVRWAGVRTSFVAERPPGVEDGESADVGAPPHAGERRESSGGRVPSGGQLVPLKRLPRELGGALEDLVGRLADPTCAPDVLRESDLSSFDVASELRQRAEAAVARARRRVPQACRDMSEATGPWLVRLVDADAIVRVRSGLPVEIRAAARAEAGRVCVGPAVVRVVGEGQP